MYLINYIFKRNNVKYYKFITKYMLCIHKNSIKSKYDTGTFTVMYCVNLKIRYFILLKIQVTGYSFQVSASICVQCVNV